MLTFGITSAMDQTPVGMRCEFNGTIEFSILKSTFTSLVDMQNIIRATTPGTLYDACNLSTLKISEFVNGNGKLRFKCKLESSQWVWLIKNISIYIELKPNPCIRKYDHEMVYFYNVFNETFHFKLGRHDFEKFKGCILIQNCSLEKCSYRFDQDEDAYYFTLAPCQTLEYPGASNLPIMLRN